MKILSLLAAMGVLLLTGCSTYRGGTVDDYETSYGAADSGVSYAPPTFRPGIDARDPRDPNALTRPSAEHPGPFNHP